MKFPSILKKIDLKSRKSMLKTGAILFWTDMKRLFNWNTDNFKSNFLSRVQLGSESNDKFFLSVLKMWQCCKYFFGNLIFALTARMLSGNVLSFQHYCWGLTLHKKFRSLRIWSFHIFTFSHVLCLLSHVTPGTVLLTIPSHQSILLFLIANSTTLSVQVIHSFTVASGIT